MKTSQVGGALRTLREFLATAGFLNAAPLIPQITDLLLALLLKIAQYVRDHHDPRLAAAHAQRVEAIYRWALREQLKVMVDCESTGAHALEEDEYQGIRENRTDYGSPPRMGAGRTCYRDTTEFISGWLGIEYFEAKRRLADSRLLVARRAMDGSCHSPRFSGLADLHSDEQGIDPRRVSRAARLLDKLEPPDTTFDGQPLDPAARHQDGRLLEEHAVEILNRDEQRTAQKKLTGLVASYRKQHKTAVKPELGIFKRASRDGVDEYIVRVQGLQAEQFRSLFGQADNARTQAGAAARQAPDCADAASQPELPDLFSTSEPPPEWAIAPEAAGVAEEPGALGPGHSPVSSDMGQVKELMLSPASGEQCALAPAPTAEEPSVQQGEDAAAAAGIEYPEVSVAQRRLNALLAALMVDHAGGKTKTIVPQVIVHMKLKDLRNLATASGVTAHGIELEAGELRQLLCEAKILPLVFNGKSQVLDMGRSQRLFSGVMRQAALARDRGCIVPGCTVPPELVECHHCQWWERGGRTCIGNCTCLCKTHHTLVHLGVLKILMVGGLAHVLLPPHLDPSQTPRRNSYFG